MNAEADAQRKTYGQMQRQTHRGRHTEKDIQTNAETDTQRQTYRQMNAETDTRRQT